MLANNFRDGPEPPAIQFRQSVWHILPCRCRTTFRASTHAATKVSQYPAHILISMAYLKRLALQSAACNANEMRIHKNALAQMRKRHDMCHVMLFGSLFIRKTLGRQDLLLDGDGQIYFGFHVLMFAVEGNPTITFPSPKFSSQLFASPLLSRILPPSHQTMSPLNKYELK